MIIGWQNCIDLLIKNATNSAGQLETFKLKKATAIKFLYISIMSPSFKIAVC